MATPHINAEPGDFAPTVLMPGDPLRAKYIAETFLDDAKLVCDVRNVFGFTGSYRGSRALDHGARDGDSLGLDLLLRAHGALRRQAHHAGRQLRHLPPGCQAPRHRHRHGRLHRLRSQPDAVHGPRPRRPGELQPRPPRGRASPKRATLPYHVGNIFSADLFYTPQPEIFDLMAKYQILGVEMESAGLYPLAAEHGVEALAVCTVSDNIRTHEAMSSADRQTSFNEMIELALETAVAASARVNRKDARDARHRRDRISCPGAGRDAWFREHRPSGTSDVPAPPNQRGRSVVTGRASTTLIERAAACFVAG